MPSAATAQKAKTFDFEKEVANIWRAFPESRDKLLFIDLGTHKLVYPGDPDTARRHRERMSEDESLLSTVKYYQEKIKNSAHVHWGDNRYILVYTDKIDGDPWNDVFKDDQFRVFVFDHEVAHGLIKGGTKEWTLSESIGDAYAMIRHFQRYGTDTGVAEKVMQRRAAIFALGEGKDDEYRIKHFTSPVIAEILKQRDKIDWKALDIKQTAELARKFALEHTPSFNDIANLKSIFHFAAKAKNNGKALSMLADILKETTSATVLKWGAAAMEEAVRQGRAGWFLRRDWEKIKQRVVETAANDAPNKSGFDYVFGKLPKKPWIIANSR